MGRAVAAGKVRPLSFLPPLILVPGLRPSQLVIPSATIFSMIDWSTCPVVERDTDRVSGAWLFFGTRVPVVALFENLEDGVSVGQFVDLFPGVTLQQARAVLEHAARSALATA